MATYALIVACWSPIAAGDTILKAASNAYRANREAIGGGTFDFAYSIGSAASMDDLVARPINALTSTRGRLLFAGSDALFELTYDVETMIRNTTKINEREFSTGSLQSYRTLRNARLTLRDNMAVRPGQRKPVHSLQLTAGPKEFDSCLIFPLDLGAMAPVDHDLSQDILRSIENRDGWTVERIEQNAKDDGRNVQRITFATPFGKREYRIDLAHGAIPVRITDIPSDRNGHPITIVQDKLQETPQGGWLPFRRMLQAAGQGRVLEIQNVEWKPPEKTRFRMDFDLPVRVFNRATGEVFDQIRSMELNALPKPKAIAKLAPEQSFKQLTAPRLREPTSYLRWCLVGGLAVAVLGIVATVLRRAFR